MIDYNLKAFGKRISNCRRELDISQKQLAAMIHVSNNHLSNIENGKSAPSFLTFVAICKELGVSSTYLINGSTFSIDAELMEKINKITDHDKKIISKFLDALPKK